MLKFTRIANLSGRKLQQPTVMSEAVVRASSVLNILNRCLPTDMMFSDANIDCSSSSEFAVSPVISHSKRLFSFAVEAKATKTCRCYLVVVGHSQLLQPSLPHVMPVSLAGAFLACEADADLLSSFQLNQTCCDSMQPTF